MVTLTRKEIYTELKRLGINTSPELKSYLREYNTYYGQPKINTSSPEELTVGIKENQPNQGTLLNQLVKIKRITKLNGYYDGLGVKLLNLPKKYLELLIKLNLGSHS